MNSKLWYHPESDCYFVDVVADYYLGVEDVSDVPEHMVEAIRRGIDVSEVNRKRNPMYQQMRIEFQKEAVKNGMWTTCLNCSAWCNGEPTVNKQFGAPDGWIGCSMAKQTPPAEIIVHGCQDHCFDIPF